MSDFFPAPPPPREWEMPRPIRESYREEMREVERLLSDPDQMAAFRARLGLLADAAPSASRSEESHRPAGSRGSATVPGPA